MDTAFALQIVGSLVVLLLAGFLYFLYYVGYFYKVQVSTGPPVISEVKVAYKCHTGNYNDCGPFFAEVVKLCPGRKAVGVYHDNPEKVDPDTCRYVVGVVIAEGSSAVPNSALVRKLSENGFKFTTFPEIEFCVKSQHPFTIAWSAFIAGMKVYPKLLEYIQVKKLTAHPIIEIYKSKLIHYMVPLSKHEGFYVDEDKYILEEMKE